MRTALSCLILLAAAGCHRAPGTAPAPAGESAPPQDSAPAEMALPAYRPSGAPMQGLITSMGSDSMEPLMLWWRDDFLAHHPAARFTFECRGSATAPAALTEGRSLLGHMSREMNEAELAKFQAKFGYAPTRIVVAADALAIYVNANNPVKGLRMEQIDAIFSSTRKGGHAPVETWGGLGLEDRDWAPRAVHPFGRDENSGTRAFFREHALKKGDFKPSVKALPDQFAVVESVAVDPCGIAYGPIQHSIRMVRSVPVADFGQTAPVAPTIGNILAGNYPLNRFLYIYVNRKPGTPLDPLVKEFLTYILSKPGQNGVATFGAIPLPADLAAVNRRKLE